VTSTIEAAPPPQSAAPAPTKKRSHAILFIGGAVAAVAVVIVLLATAGNGAKTNANSNAKAASNTPTALDAPELKERKACGALKTLNDETPAQQNVTAAAALVAARGTYLSDKLNGFLHPHNATEQRAALNSIAYVCQSVG
jgi:hypothetical protein